MTASGIIEIMLRTELRPPAARRVRHARLSPDGRRLAFESDDGVSSGVYVCERDAVTASRIVSLGDAVVDAALADLSWSPSGEHLAYVTGKGLPIGVERWVGWAQSGAAGELGRVPGVAFAWGANKPALIVADLTQNALVHVDLATQACLALGRLADDGDLDFPPSIAVSSTGKHVAFSCRSTFRDLSEVWIVEAGGEPELLTQIPGADVGVKLFWTPKGKSVAMSVAHGGVAQSAIIVVHGLVGDGEVLHHHDGLDVSPTPAWSPDGRWIAMFCRMGSSALRLAMLEVKTRKLFPVSDAVALGQLHFIDDDQLAVDGDTFATVLQLRLS
jgi:dipeptidyl aminopeptidase/acylaminoacyl peptidase